MLNNFNKRYSNFIAAISEEDKKNLNKFGK